MRHVLSFASLLLCSSAAFAQHLIVSVEGAHGAPPPIVTKDDLHVEVNRHPASVDQWIPLRGDRAALELYIVIDDGTDSDVSLQFASLKDFVAQQPETTAVGLAYLRNGSAQIVGRPTPDRTVFEKSLRLPLGEPGIAASPYMGISDLVKKWPADGARREVLLISSGVDPWSPPDPRNPWLEQAIADSQRAGVLVHSIYYSGAGHSGHSLWRSNWGQNYLSELGDETGGEAYWQGFGKPVSFDPYLKDLSQRLQNQYLLTLAASDAKSGLEPVKVTAVHSISLVAASKIAISR